MKTNSKIQDEEHTTENILFLTLAIYVWKICCQKDGKAVN